MLSYLFCLSTPSFALNKGSRAETVLNTTLAEFETFHTQKNSDILHIVSDHLDGEIALFEGILSRLRTARESLAKQSKFAGGDGMTPRLGNLTLQDEEDAENGTSSERRNPSIYERDLYSGVARSRSNRNEQRALAMPSQSVFDARGVGVGVGVGVVKEGVGVVKEGVSSILGMGIGWSTPTKSGSSARVKSASPIPGSVSPTRKADLESQGGGGSVFSRFW